MKCLWFLSLAVPASLSAALVEEKVEYEHDGVVLEGLHIYDDEVEGERPGVLVVHQWTGLGEHEQERGRRLAELGYNVLAVDIYGKGIRPQRPEAAAEAGKYKGDRELFRGRLLAGLKTLQADERTEASQIGAIGFCFGGTGVLELARSGAAVSGVVSFHGNVGAAEGFEAKEGEVKSSILVLHGVDDPIVPDAEVGDFLKEMRAAKADYQIHAYSNTVHSFTQKSAGDDPSKGSAYHELSDQRSWEAMKDFFAEVFAR